MVATGGIENIIVKKINEIKNERTGTMDTNYAVFVWFRSCLDLCVCRTYQKVPEGTTIDDMLRERGLFIGARGIMSIRFVVRRYSGHYRQQVDITEWVCSNPDNHAERRAIVLQEPEKKQENSSILPKFFRRIFRQSKA